jgi:hypothetical protein
MPSVFFSYSHADRDLRDRLEKQLSVLKREGMIDTWHDRLVEPGGEFANEIDEHIDKDDIILLLVSPDFLDSEYCYEIEMKRAMERHEHKRAVVIPIILRACDWKNTPFGKLKPLPEDGTPLNRASDIDAALFEVATAIRFAAAQIGGRRRLVTPQRQAGISLLYSAESGKAPPVIAGEAEISFNDDCVLNVPSVELLVKSDKHLIRISWHPSVLHELGRLDGWWNDFERDFQTRKPERWSQDNFQTWATRTRANLRKLREAIHGELIAAPEKIRSTQSYLVGEADEIKIEVLSQLARLSALKVVRLIQRADNFLPDPEWQNHSSFPTLSRVPDWLIDLEPKSSALGAHVFGEEHFLLARVGAEENVYEYVVLPRNIAERLQDNGRDDVTYFRWVVPQWIHYGYTRNLPPKEHWNVYALSDGRGRESWSANSPRPWRS